MTTLQKTFGQQFLEILTIAKADKAKMFMLLRSTLEKINPFPSEPVNFSGMLSKVTDMESIAAMKAARAGCNARNGAYMFADDYIYLSAKAYKDQGLGDIADFKRDFGTFLKNDNKEHEVTNNSIKEMAANQGR